MATMAMAMALQSSMAQVQSTVIPPASMAPRTSSISPRRRCIFPPLTRTSVASPPLVTSFVAASPFLPRTCVSVVCCMAQKQDEEVRDADPAPARAPDGAVAEGDDSQGVDILEGWPKVALFLFALGCLLGPPLDGIHSRVQLQIYDRGALDIAGLHTNIWVFPMLGLFYSVVGVLQLVLDKYLARKGNLPTADLKKVVFSFITLATLLEVSAEMYKAGVPFNIEAYTLFFLAEANWLLFDNTWWGFGLATLVGIACPLTEIPINKLFGLWHYPRGNIEIFGESLVTWVLACYFFYTPFISNLARYLSSITRSSKSAQKRLD